MIGHVPGQPLVVLGTFATGGPNQQIIEECDTMGANMQAAIGHLNRINAASTTFLWTAPSDADGTVDFRYTLAHPKIEIILPVSGPRFIKGQAGGSIIVIYLVYKSIRLVLKIL